MRRGGALASAATDVQTASMVGPGTFEHFGRCLDVCQSIAERRFLIALVLEESHGFRATLAGPGIATDERGTILHQQLPLNRYALDFALTSSQTPARLAIEVDGLAHHERHPWQAERDRGRDRVLLENGWPTIRFTAREVERCSLRCAREALRIFATISTRAPGLAKARPPEAAPSQIRMTYAAMLGK